MMKTAMKRCVMWCWSRRLIEGATVLRMFRRFELWGV
ncbi:MAG: hypothetical protein JWR22_1303 [Herminiimonas sp.]|nr:hypothetical protein [Herminiimonas sp.]